MEHAHSVTHPQITLMAWRDQVAGLVAISFQQRVSVAGSTWAYVAHRSTDGQITVFAIAILS